MRSFLSALIWTGTCLAGLSCSAGSDDEGGTSPGGGAISAEASQGCVDIINQYRATAGLPPYERWISAEQCTGLQAQSDAGAGAAHGAFGDCDETAQNECPGWDGPPSDMIGDCLEMMMGEGPGGGHHDAIMSRPYTQVACGFYTLPDGEVWAIQNFR